ncbi:hypothetical protein CR513_22288, partial [Mucuna pruriens]
MSMMDELKFFFGLQIKHAKYGIYIIKAKHVKELLKKFNLEDCKTMSTPMHPTLILCFDKMDKKIDQTTYKGMIDSLLYLTSYKPDIMFNKSDKYKLKVYNNANFAKDMIERKSTSRDATSLELIYWLISLQNPFLKISSSISRIFLKISNLLLSISTKPYLLSPLHPSPLQTIIHTTLDISEASPSSPIQPIVKTVLDNLTQITIQTPLDNHISHKLMDSPDTFIILRKE